MALKIAVLGAGSLFWSSTLVHDICLTPGLKGSTVSLMDIDADRLDTIYAFAKRYSSEVKFDVRLEKTLNRREAIKDADFVINVAMAGGHSYYERMRAVSEKHGYYRGINSVEWNMVSDYHTIWGYYQFELASKIAQDVERFSPDAWFLQLSNPVFELTTMIGRASKVKLIGVCHGHQDYRDIVGSMGFDSKRVKAESVGVNHTIWMTKFEKERENAYPAFREWLEEEYASFYRGWYQTSKSNPLSVQMSPATMDMYKEYGLIPVGDTVRSGTWKYHRNPKSKKKWYGALGGFDSPDGWKFYLEMEERNMRVISSILKRADVTLSGLFPSGVSNEPVTPIINSLANDVRSVQQVNAINNGALEGVPDDVAVETPAILDGRGIHRKSGYALPGRILNFSIKPRVQRMEWALEAFLEGGRELLFEWLMADQRTRSNKQAERVIEALMSMEENKPMAKHFR